VSFDQAIGERRLPRLIGPGLRLVFVGYNPGIESARQGHYYAHRGNVFWRQLHESGLTPRMVTHLDDRRLFETEAIGFIDLCPRPTVQAADLAAGELAEGARRLLEDLREAEPQVAVFGGRGIFRTFARVALDVPPRALAGREDGLQPERVGGTRLYVVPSSSGLASGWHRRRLELLEELATILVMG
jgi:TDG/mug DNA glycosylase family protein